MRQLKSLFVKEWRQSSDLFLAVLASLIILSWLFAKGASLNDNTVSVLQALPGLLLLFVPLASVSLSKRLFVSEQQMHTHKFLEALPVKRWWMLLLKYLLAVAVLSLSVVIMMLIVIAYSYQSELITGEFFLILLGRAAGYTYLVWSFCFLVGFSGRFRNTLFTAAFLVLVGIAAATSIPLQETGPLALVNHNDMPFERKLMPWQAFYQCLLWGTAASLAGFGFALWRGGMLARRMAGHMSLKEKSWAGIFMILFVMVVSFVDLKQAKEPFEFSSPELVRSEKLALDILYFDDASQAQAQALHAWLEAKLIKLREEVIRSPLPPVRVALSQSLDGETFESATMGQNDGILWRCNYGHPDFNRESFGGEIFHSVLNHSSKGMATFDPDHWFLDGFSAWWAAPRQKERLVMAHYLVKDQKLHREFIEDWALLSDRHGFQGAFHIAYSLVLHMEETWGSEVVISLARDLYSRKYHRDVRDALQRLTHPLSALLEKHTKTDFDAFMASWEVWLREQGGKAGQEFAAIPEMSSRIWLQDEDIHYELGLSEEMPELRWSLSHAALTPYDQLVEYHDLKREEHFWKKGEWKQSQVLKDTYSSGQRALVFIELELPGYRYPFQLSTQRVEIP